jgi:hypothetical protein
MEEKKSIESEDKDINMKEESESSQKKEEENKIENNNSNNIFQSNEKIVLTNGQDENLNLNYTNKRSYSCRINEPKNKNFSGGDEIKLNLNKKFLYLKTPQIKPKKSTLNPAPINIGSISCSSKKSKLNLLINDDNNIIDDVISEGDNEESIGPSNSSSDVSDDEENKNNEINDYDNFDDDYENIENENNEKDNEKDNEKQLIIEKLKSDIKKIAETSEFTIKEENDFYDEKGHLSLKDMRKEMILSKKIFSKNERDIEIKIDNNLFEQCQKFREDILIGNEQIGLQLHKTTGFGQAHSKKILPILECLKQNSSNFNK